MTRAEAPLRGTGLLPRVLLCCALPDPVVETLSEGLNLSFMGLGDVSPNQPADGLILSVETPLRAESIDHLPESLKAVGTYSVGVDHIDRQALARRGIQLLSTPDVLSVSVAETAVFLAIGAMRRATESINLMRSGKWAGWTPRQLLGRELAGKRAGIFGMGRIGQEIADRLRGMGVHISYHNRNRLSPEFEKGARYHPTLPELLQDCDLLVIACLATPQTEGVIDQAALHAMPNGSFVVNVARGSVVNDDALIVALSSGHIAGAGLDVLAGEPEYDQRYLKQSNAFLLPHIGSSTIEARVRMGAILRDGFLSLSAGETPINLVPEPAT